MESDSDNKSNSVQLVKDNGGELSENGESFPESEDSEIDTPMNLVTKQVHKKASSEHEIDSDSRGSQEPPSKCDIPVKKPPPKQKGRKNRNPRPMKPSSLRSLKKPEKMEEEDTADKDTNSLDRESPIASPPKADEDNAAASREETMDTDSETVIAPDSASAVKTEAVSSSVDDKADGLATGLSNKGDVCEMELDVKIKKEVIDMEVDGEERRRVKSKACEKTSRNKVADGNAIKIEKVDIEMKTENGNGFSGDGSQNRGDVDESAEKSSQKGKSSNIDAIAKKLGRQVKGSNEGSNENAVDGCENNNIADIKKEPTTERKPKRGADRKDLKNDKKKKKKTCEVCGTAKGLKFQVLYQGKMCYLCTDVCFNQFKVRQAISKPTPVPSPPPKPVKPDTCAQCKKTVKDGKGFYPMVGETKPLCSEDCLINYQEYNVPKKKCSQCKSVIEDDVNCLTWETMEFCNEDCLGKYQSFLGSHCTCCQSPVQQTSLGKYCVCFGADIRQFCSGSCLEEFKKGLKVCSFCQKDLSSGTDGFLAPVGDKGQFKDFCTQQCMERYETMNSKNTQPPQTQKCSFCTKSGIYKIQAKHGDTTAVLCSEPCVAGYRYANKIALKICDTCYKFFEPDKEQEFQLQFEGVNKYYCSKACMTLFVLSHRKIIPCCWCKVKKYNFDMIEKLDSSHQMQTYCSLNCISLYRVSLSATSAKSIRCDNCSKSLPAQYHLTMSDGSIRNFCTYQCVVQFQNQFTNVPTLTTATPTTRQGASNPTPVPKTTASSLTPVISSVVSLATGNPRSPGMGLTTKLVPQKLIASTNRPVPPSLTILTTKAQTPTQTITTPSNLSAVNTSGAQVIREVIVKPPPPKSLKNKAVNCKPVTASKSISCKPHPCHKAVQTEEGPVPTIIPVPVPIYVPTPVHMFSRPVPVPVPFPVPIPVPIFVPLSRDPPMQVLKRLKDIQDKIPSNPFEAELLTMAEMVAENGDKRGSDANSKTADEAEKNENRIESVDLSNEPDSEDGVMEVEPTMPQGVASVSSKESESEEEEDEDDDDDDDDDDEEEEEEEDYNLRTSSRSVGKRSISAVSVRGRGRFKRPRVEITSPDESERFRIKPSAEENKNEPAEKNLRLKHAFGVNAWKHWVLQKNAHLEQGSQSSRKFKLFKTDLLQLAPDELNYSLCLFVKEVRKPNGDHYAASSIYYLCLGIQQYLFGNGRIDNIFNDPYYERFTDCLNDILMHQTDMIPLEGFLATRIEEEILWECKQLGAHSPHVLLNTLMFFNTKFFNLRSIDDHAHLSFSHISKHWRKTAMKSNPRNVILRYYPPVNKEWQRRRKDESTMYEQNENLLNNLRCPVKLYEFYMSKCPESVKTRNDVFYLYPERSCVPDSPVWYSTQPMGREAIIKMLQRIKIIREVYET